MAYFQHLGSSSQKEWFRRAWRKIADLPYHQLSPAQRLCVGGSANLYEKTAVTKRHSEGHVNCSSNRKATG